MLGAIVLIAIMLVVFPPALFVGQAVLFALVGQDLKADVEAQHEGSEFIQLNR